jgi:hypothetical protein
MGFSLDLNALAQTVPKDPFLHPNEFKFGLASYLHSANSTSSPHLGHTSHTPSASTTNIPTSLQPSLTRQLVESIGAAHEKNRPGDPSRKMRRSLLNKLDDLTSKVEGAASGIGRVAAAATGGRLGDGEEREGRSGPGGQILSGIGSSIASGLGIGGGGHPGGPASVFEATIDLEEFVKVVVGGRMKDSQHGHAGKDGDRGVAASVRALWSGQVANVVMMRERKREWKRERLISARRKGGVHSEGDKESDHGGTDGGKSTEDESEAFGRRMQKKLESWTG